MCGACLDVDHEQLRTDELPTGDAIALRDPRPEKAAPEPPVFTLQPVGGLADADTGQITLTVAVSNYRTLRWQLWDGYAWSFVDQTSTSLTLTPTAGAVYSCVAYNVVGATRSNAVNIYPWPRLLTGYRLAATDKDDLGITGAFSMSRDIVDGFSSSRYTDNGGVSAWIDQSSGVGNFTQASSGNRPTLGTDNRLLVSFDGTDDRLDHDAISSQVFGSSEAYAILSIIIDSTNWNDGVDPYDNELIFADDGGNVALGYKSGPGSGSFTILYTRWGDGVVQGNPGLVVTEANALQQIATIEYQADGTEVGVRVGGATSTTAWDMESAPGHFDYGTNAFYLAGITSGDTAQIRSYEAIFANAAIPDTMQDALQSAMRAWATGSNGTPWLATLPAWGQPWDGLTPLDTEISFCGHQVEAQYGENSAAVGRAFLVSARNPDWLQAARFELRPEDDWNTTNRTEIETQEYVSNGRTVIVTGAFMIDSATGNDQKAMILQFHASSNPEEDVDGTSAAIAFRVNWFSSGTLIIDSQLSTTSPAFSGQANTVHYEEAITHDEWHNYVVQWRPDPTGFDAVFKIWIDGVLVVNTTQATGFTVADSYYLKFGAYNGADDNTDPFIVYHASVETSVDDSTLLSRVTSPLTNPPEN